MAIQFLSDLDLGSLGHINVGADGVRYAATTSTSLTFSTNTWSLNNSGGAVLYCNTGDKVFATGDMDVNGTFSCGTITASNGVTLTGSHLTLADEVKLKMGADSDFNIYHAPGTHSPDGGTINVGSWITSDSGNLLIHQSDADQDIIFMNDNGSGGDAIYMTLDGGTKSIDIGVPLNVGVDDAGHDVKFFGDTASKYLLWDASADKLIATGEIEAGSLDISGDADIDGTFSCGTFSPTTLYNTSLKIGRQYTSSSDQELIDFSTDGRITLNVNGAEVRWNGSALVGGTDGARDLGSTLKQWKDLHLAGDLYVKGSIVQGTPAAVSESSGTHTIVLADNDNHNVTVGNEATTIALTVASGDVGKTGMIVLTNPASVGSLSFVALPSYMLTPDGATINFVTTANAIHIISYYVHATDKVLVNYVGNFA